MNPVNAPKQPWINVLGALALYSLAFVVVTSYFRGELGRKRWKTLHFTAYGTAGLFYVHGILTDPNLKDQPIDFLDGEKVYVEICLLIVIVAMVLRWRWQLRQPPPRVHRPKQPRPQRRSLPSGFGRLLTARRARWGVRGAGCVARGNAHHIALLPPTSYPAPRTFYLALLAVKSLPKPDGKERRCGRGCFGRCTRGGG